MKSKKFLIVAFLALFLIISSNAYGLGYRFSKDQELETYLVTNSTGLGTSTLIAVTTIIPGQHRILGFRMAPYDTTGAGYELVLGLCDAATIATALDATIFDEAEKSVSTNMSADWYPYPKSLTNGLVVRLGANAVVTIYYEDIKKF